MVVATVSGVKASFKLVTWKRAMSPLAQQKMEELLAVLAVDGLEPMVGIRAKILTILHQATGRSEQCFQGQLKPGQNRAAIQCPVPLDLVTEVDCRIHSRCPSLRIDEPVVVRRPRAAVSPNLAAPWRATLFH